MAATGPLGRAADSDSSAVQLASFQEEPRSRPRRDRIRDADPFQDDLLNITDSRSEMKGMKFQPVGAAIGTICPISALRACWIFQVCADEYQDSFEQAPARNC